MLQRPVEPAQYLAIRYTERLEELGITASVGSKGDSYDTQSTMGGGWRIASLTRVMTCGSS